MQSARAIRNFATVVVLTVGVSALASALPIVVDGSLADWGVSKPTHTNSNDWTPDSSVAWWSEDFVGCNGYVGPGYGGQDSDVEALFSVIDGNKLYVAIATGVEQSGYRSGHTVYKPGDIFFDIGDNGWDFAVATGGVNPEGTIWTGTGKWWKDPLLYTASGPYRANGHVAHQTGTVDAFEYTDAIPGFEGRDRRNDHNIIEMCMGLTNDQLAAICDGGIRIHWTLACGNDVADLYFHPTGNVVPEPATLLLMGMGVAGGLVRHRRNIMKRFTSK